MRGKSLSKFNYGHPTNAEFGRTKAWEKMSFAFDGEQQDFAASRFNFDGFDFESRGRGMWKKKVSEKRKDAREDDDAREDEGAGLDPDLDLVGTPEQGDVDDEDNLLDPAQEDEPDNDDDDDVGMLDPDPVGPGAEENEGLVGEEDGEAGPDEEDSSSDDIVGLDPGADNQNEAEDLADEDAQDEDPDVASPPDVEDEDTGTPAELTRVTAQIESTHDGQIIENLDLYFTEDDALIVTHDNVIIRNCRIHHEEGNGIVVQGASNVTIENSEIINSSPPKGANPETSVEICNIRTLDAPNLTIENVIVRNGSTGINLVDSPGANISHVEGYDFYGPFPLGQFVQFNRSGDSSLTDFYAYNDPNNSWTEDNISVYDSPNVAITNGVIDGNNSPSGVGIMFEGDSGGGRVSNVDAINQGNGAFSSYSDDVTFESTRSFDNISGDQGRGDPMSNALIWNISGDGVSILNSTYTNPGNPGNIAWEGSRADVLQVSEDADAVAMTPISNQFDWI